LAKQALGAHLHAIAAPCRHQEERKEFEMRDELDGRMWVDHHEGFGEGVDHLIAKVRGAFARFAGWDGTTHQLLAVTAAFALTALNISFSTSAA